jgi:hypothetical protein
LGCAEGLPLRDGPSGLSIRELQLEIPRTNPRIAKMEKKIIAGLFFDIPVSLSAIWAKERTAIPDNQDQSKLISLAH